MKGEGFHDEEERKLFTRYLAIPIFAGLLLFVFPAGKASAQEDALLGYYATAAGHPTFNTPDPVESGFVNVANGNLHLEIPLGLFSQRGGLTARVAHTSRILRRMRT